MKNILPAPAAFYFFFFAALAAMSPFLALYYQGLGQIGLLLGISPLVSLFASPFWTGLADARHRHKAILLITIVAMILFAVVFPFLKTFALVFLFVLLLAFFLAPIVPLVDAAAISMLGERRELYGRTRLWGTIGWGVSAPLAGMFLQNQGLRWLFWIYALLMAFCLFIVSRIIFSRPANVTPFWQGLRTIFIDRRWVFFLLMLFVAGIGIAVHANYLSLLLQHLGADETLIGFAVTLTSLVFFQSTAQVAQTQWPAHPCDNNCWAALPALCLFSHAAGDPGHSVIPWTYLPCLVGGGRHLCRRKRSRRARIHFTGNPWQC
ncbi:MAG: MFS transporter, partial [Deltaproteobacteria bacterium]|nr:MFS transporter [Deltaproteobacteria bacterium]